MESILIRRPRVEGWLERLDEAIETYRSTPFAWGVHDCAMWTARCISLTTGVDLAAEFRGKYRSYMSARQLTRQHGGLLGIVDGLLTRCPVPCAMRGDVAATRTDQGSAIGIVAGADVVFPGPRGLVFVELPRCTQAWAV
jgi:hypothetical protein